MAALRPRMPHDAMIGPRISRGKNRRTRSFADASSYGKKCSRKSFSERMRPSAVLLSFSSAKQNLVTAAFRSLVGVCWSSTLSPLGVGTVSVNPSAAHDPAQGSGCRVTRPAFGGLRSHVRQTCGNLADSLFTLEQLTYPIPEPPEQCLARAGLDRERKRKVAGGDE